ncbi:MAG: sialidase family protein [Armatimonadota bacterium]|jgi:hypothetical protein
MPTTTQQNLRRLPPLSRQQADFFVYVPNTDEPGANVNQHLIVTPTEKGSFLAVWTQGTREAHTDQGIAISRSYDRGTTWTEPERIAGAGIETHPDYEPLIDHLASWAFPIVVPGTSRVYVFFNQNMGYSDPRDTGHIAFRYSDDHGETWADRICLTRVPRIAMDPEDPEGGINWLVYQQPLIQGDGKYLAGFTRCGSARKFDVRDMFSLHSEIWFMRFENILSETDPEKLSVTFLPDGDRGLRVPFPEHPEVSIAQEPTIQTLSDGRLICVMRTRTGHIYHALSADWGHTWDEPRPLRYAEGAAPLENPLAPCPLYKTRDGRYLLLFFNHPGEPRGSNVPRRPAYLAIGRECVRSGVQPLTFKAPKLLLDTDPEWDLGVEHSARVPQIATYTSYFEFEGKHYLWYPERKHFLLGKLLDEELLHDSLLPR